MPAYRLRCCKPQHGKGMRVWYKGAVSDFPVIHPWTIKVDHPPLDYIWAYRSCSSLQIHAGSGSNSRSLSVLDRLV